MSLARRIVARFLAARTDFVIPRPSYLPPEVRGKDPIVPEGTDLAIWTWEDAKGKPYGIAFQGKANKPLWNYRFPSEDRRERLIEETAKSRRLTLQRKEEESQQRKEYRHPYKVGDVLYTSWGYDQTNVNFYQVTDLKGKMIVVRPVASIVDREEAGADYVVPSKNSFTGSAIKIIPSLRSTKINGHHASIWEGKPVYETAAGWGH